MSSQIYHAIRISHKRETLHNFVPIFEFRAEIKLLLQAWTVFILFFAVSFDKIHVVFSLGQVKSWTKRIKFFTTQRILLCLHSGIIKLICKTEGTTGWGSGCVYR